MSLIDRNADVVAFGSNHRESICYISDIYMYQTSSASHTVSKLYALCPVSGSD
jgi:hypothetical protein